MTPRMIDCARMEEGDIAWLRLPLGGFDTPARPHDAGDAARQPTRGHAFTVMRELIGVTGEAIGDALGGYYGFVGRRCRYAGSRSPTSFSMTRHAFAGTSTTQLSAAVSRGRSA